MLLIFLVVQWPKSTMRHYLHMSSKILIESVPPMTSAMITVSPRLNLLMRAPCVTFLGGKQS